MEASEFEALYAQEENLWWFVGMRRIVATLLGERARPGLRCLEAGCGTGYNALDFARRFGWEVFPFDYAPEALAGSARRGLPRLARADAAALPYAGNSFDAVTSLDALTPLPLPRAAQALAEFHRVLRPGGFLLVRVAALEMLRGYHSFVIRELHRYSAGELESALRSAGFAVERTTYANTLLFPLALVKRRVLEPLRLVPLASEVRAVWPPLDRLFRAALALEDRLLTAGWRLPVGISLMALAVAEK